MFPANGLSPVVVGVDRGKPGTMKTPRMLVPKHPAQWTELGIQERPTAPLPLSSPHSAKAGQLGASLEHPWKSKRLLLPSHRSSSTQAVTTSAALHSAIWWPESEIAAFPQDSHLQRHGDISLRLLANISPLPKEWPGSFCLVLHAKELR